MAQKVQTLFIDDIDGSAADGTVRFGLCGTDSEIDLNTDHAGHCTSPRSMRATPSNPITVGLKRGCGRCAD